MYNLNFYETLTKLNELQEDTATFSLAPDKLSLAEEFLEEADTQAEIDAELLALAANDLEDLVNRIKTGEPLILPASKEADTKYNDVVRLAKRVTAKLSTTGKDSQQPYQLQLLCNAYISEKAIIDALNAEDSNLRKEVINYYKQYSDKSLLSSEDSEIATKDLTNVTDFIACLPADGTHEKIFTKTTRVKRDNTEASVRLNREKCDIHLGPIRIDVKITKGTHAQNFHNADIVLICDLNKKNISVIARKVPLNIFVTPAAEDDIANYTKPVSIGSISDLLKKDLYFITATTDVASFSCNGSTPTKTNN